MIKIKGLSAEDLNGFMDEGTEFHGELRFRNTFRIDGTLKGQRRLGQHPHRRGVGDGGGGHRVRVVSIRGTVTGRVHGRERIELLAGSRVQATLVSPRLVIEEGAFFQGECDMTPAAATKAEATALTAPRPSLPEGRS